MHIAIKRIYEEPAVDDGMRVLVDRIWPRGVSKEAATLDRWLKEVAPSTELRKWFAHDVTKWQTFLDRYAKELEQSKAAVAWLREQAIAGKVTLLYSARDEQHNQAVALKLHLLGET